MLSNVESLFTYHIHNLHEGEAEVNSESLGVITDWSHQWVVAFHQVIVQSVLIWTLERNYRRHRNMDSGFTFIITSEKNEQDRHGLSHVLPTLFLVFCQSPIYTAILQHKQYFFYYKLKLMTVLDSFQLTVCLM